MTILITGATGYVGSQLVTALLEDGEDIHALLRPTSDRGRLRGLLPGDRQHVFEGDTGDLVRIVESLSPEVIIHTAACFRAEHATKDVVELVNGNLLYATQVVEAAAQAGVKKLVNCGSSWQYYRNEPGNPVCLYAATKNAFECILRFYVERYGISVANLILFDTFGPNDPRRKLIGALLESADSGTPLPLSPGEQQLDLVHIDDVIEAFRCVVRYLRTTATGSMESFAVRSGRTVTLRQLVAMIELIVGTPLPVRFGERPYRDREVMTPWNGGEPPPGWRLRVELENGLRDVYRTHREEHRV